MVDAITLTLTIPGIAALSEGYITEQLTKPGAITLLTVGTRYYRLSFRLALILG